MFEKRSPLAAFKSIGPAIIVAAVVLGPGSILASSKVGAIFGYSAVWVLLLAAILLIGMMRVAAHVGLAYEKTPCQEIADRIGKKTAAALGIILFLIIACFQTSNNLAVTTAIEPLFGNTRPPSWTPVAGVLAINLLALAALYFLPALYKRIETIMKALVLVMILAFLANAIAAAPSIGATLKGIIPIRPAPGYAVADPYLILQALIATTFSVAAAFYQAYLVRERGWTLEDSKKVEGDTSFGIFVLGLISLLIMITSAAVFYGKPTAANLGSASDVAQQLEPMFGSWARTIFGLGIIAAAVSSFLINAMIGGTILADSLGLGSKIGERWPRHFTAAALIVGMLVGLLSATTGFNNVSLIIFAQALTVLGVPALAAALIYLATRPELTGKRKLHPRILSIAYLGAAVAIVLAFRTATSLIAKLFA
ncbi:MAG: manganese transport protein [Pseudoalteromonas tetraodonis]|jgi:manganese transport protein